MSGRICFSESWHIGLRGVPKSWRLHELTRWIRTGLLGSANGNRTCLVPVQASRVGCKSMQTRAGGMVATIPPTLGIPDVVARWSPTATKPTPDKHAFSSDSWRQDAGCPAAPAVRERGIDQEQNSREPVHAGLAGRIFRRRTARIALKLDCDRDSSTWQGDASFVKVPTHCRADRSATQGAREPSVSVRSYGWRARTQWGVFVYSAPACR